jgi:hypothetical protein
MSRFIVRVELHGAIYEDYVKLHAEMKARGMTNFIVGDNRVTYQLPTATYAGEGNIPDNQVLSAAKAAAATTGRKFAVLVANYNACTWEGLHAA